MQSRRSNRDVGASPVAASAGSGRTFSRRQALGRMSAVATAGAAAWVVPEILTAKPAAGATMSGTPRRRRRRLVENGGGTWSGGGTTGGARTGTPGDHWDRRNQRDERRTTLPQRTPPRPRRPTHRRPRGTGSPADACPDRPQHPARRRDRRRTRRRRMGDAPLGQPGAEDGDRGRGRGARGGERGRPHLVRAARARLGALHPQSEGTHLPLRGLLRRRRAGRPRRRCCCRRLREPDPDGRSRRPPSAPRSLLHADGVAAVAPAPSTSVGTTSPWSSTAPRETPPAGSCGT